MMFKHDFSVRRFDFLGRTRSTHSESFVVCWLVHSVRKYLGLFKLAHEAELLQGESQFFYRQANDV